MIDSDTRNANEALEFIARFRSELGSVEWTGVKNSMNSGSGLRTTDSKCECPITFLANRRRKDSCRLGTDSWPDGVAVLGLSRGAADLIVTEADTGHVHSATESVHSSLREACGVS